MSLVVITLFCAALGVAAAGTGGDSSWSQETLLRREVPSSHAQHSEDRDKLEKIGDLLKEIKSDFQSDRGRSGGGGSMNTKCPGNGHADDWNTSYQNPTYFGYQNPTDQRFVSVWEKLSNSMDYCPETHGQKTVNMAHADASLKDGEDGKLKGQVILRNQALTSGPWVNFLCNGQTCTDSDTMTPSKLHPFIAAGPGQEVSGTLTTVGGANIIWPKFASVPASSLTGALIATRCLGEKLGANADKATNATYKKTGSVIQEAVGIEQQYRMMKANNVKMLFSLAPSLYEMKNHGECHKACMGVSKRDEAINSWNDGECHPYHESDKTFTVDLDALGNGNKMVTVSAKAAARVWPGAIIEETKCLGADLTETTATGDCAADGTGCDTCRFRRTEIKVADSAVLTHYWYLHWHDYKVPKKGDMYLWLELLHDKALPISDAASIAAHCWSGKGRTGTILALLAFMINAKTTCPVATGNGVAEAIADIAVHFRSMRINMVERPWQFGWVLTAATIYAKNGCKMDGLKVKFDAEFALAAGDYKSALEDSNYAAKADCCAGGGGAATPAASNSHGTAGGGAAGGSAAASNSLSKSNSNSASLEKLQKVEKLVDAMITKVGSSKEQ